MSGNQHRLLIYEKVYKQRRLLYLFVALVFAGLFALPYLDILDAEAKQKLWPAAVDPFLLALSVVSFLFFLQRLIAPRRVYVQCTPNTIRIQTPLFPIVISYRRVIATRQNMWGKLFPPEKMTRSRRRDLNGIQGEGVIVLDLSSWPAPPGWLRLWIPDVMFSPDSRGLVLWVKDWMLLNRELTDFKDRWRDAHSGSKPDVSVYSRMKR